MPNNRLRSHLNAPKLRVDTWSNLSEIANDLHYEEKNPKKVRELAKKFRNCLDILMPIEVYFAFPGVELCNKVEMLFIKNAFDELHTFVSLIVLALRSNISNCSNLLKILHSDNVDQEEFIRGVENFSRYYFEVLIVDDVNDTQKELIKQEINDYLSPEDKFVYELVFVDTFHDAVMAVMFNFNIKCCIISNLFKYDPDFNHPLYKSLVNQAGPIPDGSHHPTQLANTIRNLRQREVDLFYLSSYAPEKQSAQVVNSFDRIFYDFENDLELHLSILQSIKSHFETPFFDALKQYTLQPKRAFHALPIARGKSIFKSKWVHEMHEFYGKNLFLAESSSTGGGLDSLVNPIGSLRLAMQKASAYFGSHHTYFVTNGTSASNKIVLQAVLKPKDLLLIEHSCHESHHYGIILADVFPIFLNGYSIKNCDIAGPIPLRTIKKELFKLKKENLLDQVKAIVLTNCTFDGIVYNVQWFMEEILAIKPDMIFIWDEAWFAYARCVPHYRLRSGMYAAAFLENKYKQPGYREEYLKFKEQLKGHEEDEEYLLTTRLLPDPDQVRLRVYCTQSTHKTLSCLRQGSMIHIYDATFEETFKDSFLHSFITHSTTSPNYQILATMDLGRRQAELEGFELVQHAIELAMTFRQTVNAHPIISQYFIALGPSELIPEKFRLSKVASGYDPGKDWGTVEQAWLLDEFVIDPTRVTLMIKQGLDGYTLRNILMDKYGIQVNKVSLNSILIQFNIGTLRSSVSFLIESLLELVHLLIQTHQDKKPLVLEPTIFSKFDSRFLPYPHVQAGDLRKAYYEGYDDTIIEYLSFKSIEHRLDKGEKLVSAALLMPTPPGYPALVPGQIITKPIIEYLLAISPTSIVGLNLKGIKIFK